MYPFETKKSLVDETVWFSFNYSCYFIFLETMLHTAFVLVFQIQIKSKKIQEMNSVFNLVNIDITVLGFNVLGIASPAA